MTINRIVANAIRELNTKMRESANFLKFRALDFVAGDSLGIGAGEKNKTPYIPRRQRLRNAG